MHKRGEIILNEFIQKLDLLNNFCSSSEQLIKSLLQLSNIRTHQIVSRLKTKSSLEKKIIKKDFKYKSLFDITDVVGIRIITYFEDEIDLVAKLIEDEFEIDIENSIDKRVLSEDKFGYRSLHYVLSYKKNRLRLSEYSRFKNLKFEIQIRSILQHSWAEIEHDLGYKGENEIPKSMKRTFYRVAALLEQADLEFVKLKNSILEYEKDIDQKVIETPLLVELNKASLGSFIYNNVVIKEIEDSIIASREGLEKIRLDDDDYATDQLITKLKRLGVKNISDLEQLYLKNKAKFLEKYIEDFKQEDIAGFAEGATINWLVDFVEKTTAQAHSDLQSEC